ncbi:MAG: hypothetical protein PHO23_01450 [Candidatus Pacebacteria bacterium]|nr:hypothetical protein [Candidatus Paceibacterota bacterium]
MKKTTKISIVQVIILSVVVITGTIAVMVLLLPKEPSFVWFFGLIIITMIIFFGTVVCFDKLKKDAQEAEKNKK